MWFLFILKKIHEPLRRSDFVGFFVRWRNMQCVWIHPKKKPIKSFLQMSRAVIQCDYIWITKRKMKCRFIWTIRLTIQLMNVIILTEYHCSNHANLCYTSFLSLSFIRFFLHLNVWIIMYCKIRCNISYGVFKKIKKQTNIYLMCAYETLKLNRK